MTQPQPQPAAPPESNTGTVVAAAVVGLALIAVEARVREEVEDDIRDALLVFAALLIVVLASPAVVVVTGTDLLSRPEVHDGLAKSLGTAKTKVSASITAGYGAAVQLAKAKTAADLKTHGYQVPATLPALDPSIDQINRDLDTMFGHAQTDIQNTVRDAFDGVQGPDADAARQLVAKQAVDQAAARLQQRAAAAAGTAVHQGSSDAQQALFTQYQNSSGRLLAKRWVATASDPCGMCEALHGTVVAISAEFDHQATTADKDLRPVWRNLLGPPRHPNCRCQLELVTT